MKTSPMSRNTPKTIALAKPCSSNQELISIAFGMAALLVALFVATPGIAQEAPTDSTLIPIGSSNANTVNTAHPSRGASKDIVQQRFGEPKEWTDAVGEPPISRWDYEQFSVYFENDTVLHSVVRRTQ